MDYPQTDQLSRWAEEGVEVDCGQAYSWAAVLEAIQHGAHHSAFTPEAIKLVQEDVRYQVQAGFCKIMEWESLCKQWPKHPMISPVTVVPQIGQQGCIILDLLFPVYKHENKKRRQKQQIVIQLSVNEMTAPLAPE
eukprot:7913036-Ditylum_brightwellii.AAC.1